jgi:hypothetical protein
MSEGPKGSFHIRTLMGFARVERSNVTGNPLVEVRLSDDALCLEACFSQEAMEMSPIALIA